LFFHGGILPPLIQIGCPDFPDQYSLDYKTPREVFECEIRKTKKPLVRGMMLERLLT